MHLVLHRLEKFDAFGKRRVVIDTGGVDVGDLLAETALGGPDILNPAKQLIEVIERLIGTLQPLVIEHEPFDDILFQALGRPDAKTGSKA